MPSPSDPRSPAVASPRMLPLALDRIACTGHGLCASILPQQISLDEWGYPVLHAALAGPALGDAAIRLCPARALAWSRLQTPTTSSTIATTTKEMTG